GDGECQTGHCADGLCCDTACGGQCEACDVAGTPGICVPVTGVPHGSRPSCAAGSKARPCAPAHSAGTPPASCEGFPGVETVCSDASCAGGGATPAASCDGAGHCQTSVGEPCDPFACKGTECATKCASDADCTPPSTCDERGACTTPVAGEPTG